MDVRERALGVIGRKRGGRTGRQEWTQAIAVLRQMGYTVKALSRLVKRDHSTVCYHCRRHYDLLRLDKAYRKAFEEFCGS